MSLRLAEHPAFVRYWLGQSVSVAGSTMRELTIAWLILDATGSELWLAGAALARTAAMLLLTPWASLLADQLSRTRIVLLAESGSLVVSLVLAGLSLAGALPAPALVAAAALLGALHAFEAPARNVLVHDLVIGGSLMPALSLFSASQGAARVLGPALGGLLVERFGAAPCFLIDAASYAVLLGAVLSLPRLPGGVGGSSGGLGKTLGEVLRREKTRRVFLLLLVLSLVAGAYRPLLPAIAAELLGLGPDGLGALQACAALGALAAGLTLGRGLLPFGEARVLALSALLAGIPVALLGLEREALTAAATIAVSAALLTAGEAAANTRLQVLAPAGERARHVGLYTIAAHLYPVGGWLLALLAAALGLGQALVVAGLASLALAASLQGLNGSRAPAAPSSR